MKPYQFAIDELRAVVKAFNNCNESFNERFSAWQLITLHRAWMASGWDFSPDTWTDLQIKQALVGYVPMWDDNEKPVTDLPPGIKRTTIVMGAK